MSHMQTEESTDETCYTQTSRYREQHSQAAAALKRHTGAAGGVAGAKPRALPGVCVAALQRARLLQLARGCCTAEIPTCMQGCTLNRRDLRICHSLQADVYHPWTHCHQQCSVRHGCIMIDALNHASLQRWPQLPHVAGTGNTHPHFGYLHRRMCSCAAVCRRRR